ncbi:hypothetical protein BH09ACT10_BH09ACT10_26100 [soil metagenome]
MGSADGWTVCGLGHRHWGLVGAAGLLVMHTDLDGVTRYLLQHRSAEVHHGLTWGVPGGALEHDESPQDGAAREVREEFGQISATLHHVRTHVDDHGGWTYYTVVTASDEMFETQQGGWETGKEGFTWATAAQIDELDLHPGFAKTWPVLI